MRKTQKQEKPTLESLWAYLHETSREFKEMGKETDRRIKKTEHHIKETGEKIREVSKQLGIIGNNNGDFAEEYFISAFQKNPTLNGEMYNRVMHNVRPFPEIEIENENYNDEYDIFLLNGKSVAIIEIKYSARKDTIGELLKKAENFRKFQPKYNGHKLYLGIASLSFRKTTEENILKNGIAVIKQVGDKMVINSESLKAF